MALYLLHGGWQVGRESLDVLMDRELPDDERQRIVDIVRGDPEVRGVHELRTRSSGLTKFIQFHVELDPTLTLAAAHGSATASRPRSRQAFPQAEIILHVDRLEGRIAGADERAGRPSSSKISRRVIAFLEAG